MNNYRYDLTLSFAGEDREIVEEIAKRLKVKYSIFYDKWEEATLWGKDLYQYLDYVFKDSSRFCLVFISENYKKKAWTRHELRSAQARAFSERNEYILPLRLDDTVLPGLPETIGYLDIRDKKISEIEALIERKLEGEVDKKPEFLSLSDIARQQDYSYSNIVNSLLGGKLAIAKVSQIKNIHNLYPYLLIFDKAVLINFMDLYRSHIIFKFKKVM